MSSERIERVDSKLIDVYFKYRGRVVEDLSFIEDVKRELPDMCEFVRLHASVDEVILVFNCKVWCAHFLFKLIPVTAGSERLDVWLKYTPVTPECREF